jgi:hypothetical protein
MDFRKETFKTVGRKTLLEFQNVYFSPNIVWMIGSRRMKREEHEACMGECRSAYVSSARREPLKERFFGKNGRKYQDVRHSGLDSSGSRSKAVTRCCKHDSMLGFATMLETGLANVCT